MTEFPIVTDVKPEQSSKAKLPILVTEFGIITDVKPEQFSKALLPILVTIRVQLWDVVIDAGILMSPLAPVLTPTATVVGEVTI